MSSEKIADVNDTCPDPVRRPGRDGAPRKTSHLPRRTTHISGNRGHRQPRRHAYLIPHESFSRHRKRAAPSVKSLLGRVSRGLTRGRSEYRDFCERLNLLRVRDGLENVGVRDMDRFLWLWGLWLAQHGREKRVINEEVYDVFVSKDPDVQLLVRSLEPAVVESP